jgi:hypothetical protein
MMAVQQFPSEALKCSCGKLGFLRLTEGIVIGIYCDDCWINQHQPVTPDELYKYCMEHPERFAPMCSTCEKKPGKKRVDNGLVAGIHCDDCWDEMVTRCRSRSW